MLQRFTRYGLLVLAGCYAPSAPAGVPCADNGACPSGQACVAGVCGGSLPEDAPAADAAVDAATVLVDAPSVDTPASTDCWAAWADGPPTLGAVSLLISTPDDDTDPVLNADGVGLYFIRKGDIYRATRSSQTASFGTPNTVAELDTTSMEGKVTLSGDNLTIVFPSTRSGIIGDYNLWIATRPTYPGTFKTPTELASPISSPNNQLDPWLSTDALTLYYVEQPPLNTSTSIQRVTRPSTSVAFGSPSPVALSGAAMPYDPVLSPDELTIIYNDNNGHEVATRSDKFGAFHPPKSLTLPNGADNVELSRDGCEVVFDAPGATSVDIFHAFVTP